MHDDLLRLEGLRVQYRDRDRTVHAVDGVDLTLRPGATLGLLGESGCGKSTLALSVLGLLPSAGHVAGGRILYRGRDLLRLPGEELRTIRGREISMIFQDPVSGLNPVMSVGAQVAEIVQTHLGASGKDAKRIVIEALSRQGLAEPERVANSYPFQLSGGMCQRIMIAIATVLRPRIVIADEPTSALDVTVQAGILNDLATLRDELGVAILLITHDLGVIAQMADEIAVMYAGRVVERGSAETIFARPRHPYTAALIAARPRVDAPGRPLAAIPGSPPDLGALTGECAFLPRCKKAVIACRTQPWPSLSELAPGHEVACFNPMFHPD